MINSPALVRWLCNVLYWNACSIYVLPCSCLCAQAEELQLVRDALRSLRNSFSGHDPQQHTLDTLEQGVASLMDRLHAVETSRRHERRVRHEGRPCASDLSVMSLSA